MSRKRKAAISKIESLTPQVERHLQRVLSQPEHSSRGKWVGEILGWLQQMEELLPHVGKKTAAEWQTRIATWRATLGGAQEAQ
jgi:hypothetical protein